ncbi:MAG: methyltransferase [Pseudomonadota bacterium]
MSIAETGPPARQSGGGLRGAWRRFRNRLAGSADFQAQAQKWPVAKQMAKKDGERLFDLIAGFTYTQTLYALTERGALQALAERDLALPALARIMELPEDRARLLADGGVGLGLMERVGGDYGLSRLGAAFLGAPGLIDLVLHHRELYADLSDPTAILRGEVDTRLSQYWPYVFGAGAAEDPEAAARYSNLMANSQAMVAADTLAAVSLTGVKHLMDVGGGDGAFAAKVGEAYPAMRLTACDLPPVAERARARFSREGLSDRADAVGADFRTAIPATGADAISLIRVLYDHEDETVRGLLSRVYEALPPGGHLLVSEPMGGGDAPHRFGDVYFALYCLAMKTGRVRSAARIGALMAEAGFSDVTQGDGARAYVTTAVMGRKPN